MERYWPLVIQILVRLKDCANIRLVKNRQELTICRDLHLHDPAKVFQILLPAKRTKLQILNDHLTTGYDARNVDINQIVWCTHCN